jgi:hypothetical protein
LQRGTYRVNLAGNGTDGWPHNACTLELRQVVGIDTDGLSLFTHTATIVLQHYNYLYCGAGIDDQSADSRPNRIIVIVG